jgi:WD40 repeat protein
MRSLLTLSLLLLPAVAFADDKKPPTGQAVKIITLDRKDPVTYEKDVEPIFVKKCFTCHSGKITKSKLDLGSYETLMKGGKRGKPVTPGNAANSQLYKSAGKMAEPTMPPEEEGDPLTPEELALIKLWIDQGAKAPVGMREKVKVVVGLPPAPVHPVRALAVSPDKSTVAAGRGNEIHVYDAGSGAYIRSLVDPNLTTPDKKPVKAAHLSLVESMAFSPDGKFLASGSFQEVILWDVQTGAVKFRLTGYADRVVALNFSPDGKWLATGGGAPTEDGEIRIVEVPSGNLVKEIKNGHSDQVFGVCFSPDGKMLATCGADKFVKVWEMPSGKFIKSFEGHTHHVMDVGWKADGKLLVSAGSEAPTAISAGLGVIKIWDFDKGEQKQTVQAGTRQITRLLFVGKTGQFATCSGDQTVKFWNVDNGGNTRTLSGNTDYLYALGVSPDGTVVATGGEDGVVRLYTNNSNAPTKSLLPPGVELPMPPKK